MNFPVLVDLASNYYRNSQSAVTQQKQPTDSLKTAPQLDISIENLTYDLVLPADQLQPADARGNDPARGKAFCRGVMTTAFCANPIKTDCLKPVHVNHHQIEERKVCPLFKRGLSELVKSWGLVVGAKEVANQESQTNALPSQESKRQRITQDTGPTLTCEEQRTLNEGVIFALKYRWYDILERIQFIVEITGAELTEDARIALSNGLVQAVDDHRLYDQAMLLLSFIVSTDTELTKDDRIALSNGLIVAIDNRLYDKAKLLLSIIVSTGTE
ncbi:hypothetical protein, partial [Endozoicomonas acroporae]